MTLKSRKNTLQRGIDTMMIEPTINMEEFRKDVNNGMGAWDLKDKYVLTTRQYHYLIKKLNKKSEPYFKEPYITMQRDKYYIIRKNNTYYGQYPTILLARAVKRELIKVKWDKNELNRIRKSFGLKPLRCRL